VTTEATLPRLSELRAKYAGAEVTRSLPSKLEAALKSDPRPGARALLDAIERKRHVRRSEGQRLRKMLRFETALWDVGTIHVAGVDEAGMSPLAARCVPPR